MSGATRPARLTACIPTWNGAAFLRRTLSGLLAQDAAVDLRIVVGDDASEDETVAVARSFADPRIAVHAFANRLGLAGNWNRVLRLADGDYIALVGQDDEVAPWWAARLVGLLERHPEADLAFGSRTFAFDDDESRRAVGEFFERAYPAMLAPFHARTGEVIPPEQMIDAAQHHRFEINLIGEPSFAVFRRSAPAVAEGFDEAMAQMIDWEFFTRFFVDRPVLRCADVVGTYHIHHRGASVGNASLSTHYRDYDHLLGVVLRRFAAALGAEGTSALEQRRADIRKIRSELMRREPAPPA